MFFSLFIAQFWAVTLLLSFSSTVYAHSRRDAAASLTNVDPHDHGSSPGWIQRSNQTIHHHPPPAPLSTVKLSGRSISANTSTCHSSTLKQRKRDIQATATSTKSTFLVFARDTASAYSAYSPLNDYGIPYELIIVPANGITLPTLKASSKVGNYGGIVVLSEVSYQDDTGDYSSALTDDQWEELYDYQVTFGARMVRIDVLPSDDTGTGLIDSCCDDTQEQFISISNSSYFPTAGLTVGADLSTLGLYHYPATITNSSLATAFATFGTTTDITSPSVAGVINTFSGRSQMVFFLPFSTDWSVTSTVLGHAWLHWATRGIYAGYRRIMLNTQVDDMFLTTDNYDNTSFRISATDLTNHVAWQKDMRTRLMPSGSNYTIEIGHNGNGNIGQSDTLSDGICGPVGPLQMPAQPVTALEYVKPLGTGTSIWPSNATEYEYTDKCISTDLLAQFFQNTADRDSFMHVSHTFTHEDLNAATYSDAYNQIKWNQDWLNQSGIANAKWFSPTGLIPPAITGLHNGDALRAFSELGIIHVVGDNTRSVLLNQDNEHWPLITTVAADGFDGIQITPRWATNIYYNCDIANCDDAEWNSFGNTGNFTALLDVERDSNSRHLLGLHHDPFMFHQGNLHIDTSEQTGTGGQSSLLQQWVQIVVAEVTRIVDWPIISLKHDYIAASFRQRAARDACNYTMTYKHSGSNIVGFTVSAPSVDNVCSAPIPVTVPTGGVSDTQGFVTEQLGNDPLTIWVDLTGDEADFSLKFAVPW